MRLRLIDKVEHCLKNFPETRNSDVELTLKIVERFHCSHIANFTGKRWVDEEALKNIREDHVKRLRARFNERGMYLPTEEKILKQRKLLEKKWHFEMSPSNPARG